MRTNKNIVADSILVIAISSILALVINAFRSDRLPLVRRTLSETRAIIAHAALIDPHDATPRRPDIATPPTIKEKLPEQPDPKTPPQIKETEQQKPTKSAPSTPKPRIQALFTTLADAKACFDSKSAIFIDARLELDYQAEHVPGAISLYYGEFDKLYAKGLGDVPKDRLLVTYCSDPECESATKLADALVAKGHTRVVILLEGLPGWKSAGYPTVGEGE